MTYFTISEVEIPGVGVRWRYMAPRNRDGIGWTFYATAKGEWTYSPTWPEAVKAAFPDVPFFALLEGDVIALDFVDALTEAQEAALDALYEDHVAPVET